MKVSTFVFFAGMVVLLSACKKDSLNSNALASVETLKNELSLASSSSILITSVDSSSVNGYTTIHYEDGSSIRALSLLLTSVVRNPAGWNSKISFADGSWLLVLSVGTLTITDSMVTINPSGNAPLTADIKITVPVAGTFEVNVHGKAGGGVDISHHFAGSGTQFDLPVLGLYENYANQVELKFFSASGYERASHTVTVTTAPVAMKPTLDIKVNTLPATDGSIFLFSNAGPWGFDQKGEVRYYYTGDMSFIYGKLKNGNLIISSAQGLVSYYSPAFHEVTMLGAIVKTYSVTNSQHHDIRELPDGNFLVATNSAPIDLSSAQFNEDMVEEIDRETGQSVNTWNLSQILDPFRAALPDSSVPADWFHLNSIFFNESDNSLILSGRSQSAVVKLDYQTKQIKWILADHHDWNKTLSPYLLRPVNSAGDSIATDSIDFWPYGQHHVWQLPNGHIFMMDDGDYRNYYSNNKAPAISYTRAAEYTIDEVDKTVSLSWTYDKNKSIFAEFTGSVEQFDDQTRMMGYLTAAGGVGEIPKILILDNQNNPVFEVNVNLGQNYYRAYKFDLYRGLE